VLFFFLFAILVNQFAMENKRQVARYQALSETLEETNRQLRRAEEEARRSERLAALGQLSAGLAHEIRNPLGVIKGAAEMLSQKVADTLPLASELAGYISSEVNRLNALVSRFLDFARPMSLEARPLRISEVVDRSLESVHHQLPDLKVKVERHYAAAQTEILADEQLCERERSRRAGERLTRRLAHKAVVEHESKLHLPPLRRIRLVGHTGSPSLPGGVPIESST